MKSVVCPNHSTHPNQTLALCKLRLALVPLVKLFESYRLEVMLAQHQPNAGCFQAHGKIPLGLFGYVNTNKLKVPGTILWYCSQLAACIYITKLFHSLKQVSHIQHVCWEGPI